MLVEEEAIRTANIVNLAPVVAEWKVVSAPAPEIHDYKRSLINVRDTRIDKPPVTFLYYGSREHNGQDLLEELIERDVPTAARVLTSEVGQAIGAVIITDFRGSVSVAAPFFRPENVQSVNTQDIRWGFNYQRPLKLSDVSPDKDHRTAIMLIDPNQPQRTVVELQDRLLKICPQVITVPIGKKGSTEFKRWSFTYNAPKGELTIHSDSSPKCIGLNFFPNGQPCTEIYRPSIYEQYLHYVEDNNGRVLFDAFRDLHGSVGEIIKKYPSDFRFFAKTPEQQEQEQKILSIRDPKQRALEIAQFKEKLYYEHASRQADDIEKTTGIELDRKQKELFIKLSFMKHRNGTCLYRDGIPTPSASNNEEREYTFVQPWELLPPYDWLREVCKMTDAYYSWGQVDEFVARNLSISDTEKDPPLVRANEADVISDGKIPEMYPSKTYIKGWGERLFWDELKGLKASFKDFHIPIKCLLLKKKRQLALEKANTN